MEQEPTEYVGVGGELRRDTLAEQQRQPGRPLGRGRLGAFPLGARIFAICNAFEAMTSERPYRPRYSAQQAIAELRRGSGTQFDPSLVEPFIAMVQPMPEP